MVWKVVKSAQPPVRYRPNSDRRPDIVNGAAEHPVGPGHRGAPHTNPALSRVKWVTRVLGGPLSAVARARARAGPPLLALLCGTGGCFMELASGRRTTIWDERVAD